MNFAKKNIFHSKNGAFLQASIINLHKNKMLACRKGVFLQKKYISSLKITLFSFTNR